ncbi:hypothetical protein ACAY42_000244 [Citrobacter freundii]|uniref:hypothetical protein n=1 Tax=Citrobacter freundii complex TaxID=1344959 RepID=UPI000CDDD642|nr:MULTISPECIES: hypothetical protein [Citrobacter freundii complex]ECW4903021.1 hypothetical protein [Salmonella enterica subsp. enterica serovar Senftenberg]EED3074870.1 hypothetical protein [Salmonella enterica subsp. enterica serovar Enteritidis]EJH9802904.1 hypothetical protein [Salmonella enterica]AYL71674.1 hypothetical protein CUC51_13525 [Citrobacter freundii]ELS5415962.1 hypothetical protein [Citrobacter freundii]
MKQIAQENIIELVKLGHERASELKASCGAVDVRSLAQLISDLATQLEVQYVRAEESQREFRSADITMQNLEAKCAALAAENSGLKNQDPKAWYIRMTSEVTIDQAEADKWRGVPLVLANTETPATDAFLAEVRAQARNELIDELESRFNEMTETLPPELRSGAAGAAAFVSTFRKGAAL